MSGRHIFAVPAISQADLLPRELIASFALSRNAKHLSTLPGLGHSTHVPIGSEALECPKDAQPPRYCEQCVPVLGQSNEKKEASCQPIPT